MLRHILDICRHVLSMQALMQIDLQAAHMLGRMTGSLAIMTSLELLLA